MQLKQIAEYFSQFPFAELRSNDGKSTLKICTYGYAYPEADNEYDADWHKNLLYCNIPSFRAEIDEIILEGHVLTHYLKQLREFLALERSNVEFEPTEPYFDLELTLDSRKKVLVNGHIQYPAGWGAELGFEFETDLTFVEHFANGIENISREFPAKR